MTWSLLCIGLEVPTQVGFAKRVDFVSLLVAFKLLLARPVCINVLPGFAGLFSNPYFCVKASFPINNAVLQMKGGRSPLVHFRVLRLWRCATSDLGGIVFFRHW